jgi:hypothetical protein
VMTHDLDFLLIPRLQLLLPGVGSVIPWIISLWLKPMNWQTLALFTSSGRCKIESNQNFLKYLYPLTAPNHSKNFPVAVASSDYLTVRMRMVISVSEIMCLVIIPLPSQIFCTFLPFSNWLS